MISVIAISHLRDNGVGQVSGDTESSEGTPMAGQVRVDWPTCEQDDCIGIRLDSGKCLAHAHDQERKAALEQIAETGKVDVRGVTITGDLLEQILAAVPSNLDGKKTFAEVWFSQATFPG